MEAIPNIVKDIMVAMTTRLTDRCGNVRDVTAQCLVLAFRVLLVVDEVPVDSQCTVRGEVLA